MSETIKFGITESDQKLINCIKNGGVCVIPTDFTYGIICSVNSPEAVAKIFAIKQRDLSKPLVILINNTGELFHFNLLVSNYANAIINKYWPGKLTMVFPCLDDRFSYLHQGTTNLSFRMPDYPWLQDIMAQTGTLITTSANSPGESSARTIEKAVANFGEEIDLYVDAGQVEGRPPTVVAIDDKKITLLKQGSVLVEEINDPGF